MNYFIFSSKKYGVIPVISGFYNEYSIISQTIQFSIDEGETWNDCSGEIGLSGNFIVGEAGQTIEFLWDTAQDIPEIEENVILRIGATDSEGNIIDFIVSNSFRIDNINTPLEVFAKSPVYVKLQKDNKFFVRLI